MLMKSSLLSNYVNRVSSSSWGLGRAAVCDCGTPWTFLLPFLGMSRYIHNQPLNYSSC